jgi:hypothetical protein
MPAAGLCGSGRVEPAPFREEARRCPILLSAAVAQSPARPPFRCGCILLAKGKGTAAT